jgi:hypothetical protein
MIRHIVLTRFKPGTPEHTIRGIYTGLAGVAARLEGARGFVGGRSSSPEQIERGYLHGFTIDFDDWDALQRYADDPAHQSLGAQLVDTAIGGIDGVLVLDIEV